MSRSGRTGRERLEEEKAKLGEVATGQKCGGPTRLTISVAKEDEQGLQSAAVSLD